MKNLSIEKGVQHVITLITIILFVVGCGSKGDGNPDNDGDGILDAVDAFPNNAAEQFDDDKDPAANTADN